MSPGPKRRSLQTSTEADVREALLGALTELHSKFPTLTLAQYLVVLEVLVAETRGAPHTLTTLGRTLGMPHSTVSRLVWTLTAQGGKLEALRYEPHPKDRRIKHLRIERSAAAHVVPRALMKKISSLRNKD
jgi:DNA-binding MarR family transcriptional regulator